jgi:hypothetical protein
VYRLILGRISCFWLLLWGVFFFFIGLGLFQQHWNTSPTALEYFSNAVGILFFCVFSEKGFIIYVLLLDDRFMNRG